MWQTKTAPIFPLFSFHELLRLVVAVAFFGFLSSSGAEAFVRRPNNGMMKLCPPGGQSFATAWEITCGMRRRKRDATASLTATTEAEEQQMTVGDVGNEQKRTANDDGIGADALLHGQRRTNGTAMTTTMATVAAAPIRPKTWWHSIGEMFFGRSPAIGGNNDASASADDINDKQLYRPPSMTEMMLFCCRFGCSLRDLLPYCDPFGEWDS